MRRTALCGFVALFAAKLCFAVPLPNQSGYAAAVVPMAKRRHSRETLGLRTGEAKLLRK